MKAEKFCNHHCTWRDHHPDCALRTEAAEEAYRRCNAGWALMCKKMVAIEREACAEVSEQQIERWMDDRARYAASECAAAIRARGLQGGQP